MVATLELAATDSLRGKVATSTGAQVAAMHPVLVEVEAAVTAATWTVAAIAVSSWITVIQAITEEEEGVVVVAHKATIHQAAREARAVSAAAVATEAPEG